ncbi:helix-turn-helix domain-containing protein [Streptomyces sp. JJ36]|nr:helix-turn-helix domain-containing protein [Streptomyces sp. JJ36]
MARGQADFDGDTLRRLRTQGSPCGLVPPMSAAALGAAVGATKAEILAYESGQRSPEVPRLVRLAQALHVQPADLLCPDRWPYWTLADIRRANGLRSIEVGRHIRASHKVYRRFEVHGLVPHRRPRLLEEVAELFHVSRFRMHICLDATPAVRDRVVEVSALTQDLFREKVSTAGTWVRPGVDVPEVRRIAALYARSPTTVSRILGRELFQLRRGVALVARERATAWYDPEPERQSAAESRARRHHQTLMDQVEGVSTRIERFFRQSLPGDAWQSLMRLLKYGTREWVSVDKLGSAAALELLPRAFAESRLSEEGVSWRATRGGFEHARTFGAWYAQLYPTVRVPTSARHGRYHAVPERPAH